MLASQNIIDAFNQQVGNEMGASMQYISIASYFESENLMTLAEFFFQQSDEEREHSMKFVKFILEVGGDVVMPAIPAPPSSFKTAHDAVQAALDWEQEVTRQIYDLVDLAQEERNHIAKRFLDWFVDEQLEEVATMSTLLGIVERAGEDNLLFVEDYLSRHDIRGEEEGNGG